ESKDSTFGSTLTVSNNALTNNGTVQINQGSGGARAILGSIDNKGTLAIGANSTLGKANTPSSNSGTITVATGTASNFNGHLAQSGTLTLAAGGSLTAIGDFTDTGPLTVDPTATFIARDGSFTWTSGAISGTVITVGADLNITPTTKADF